MTACFMGIAVLGLSLGMQQLLMQQRKTSLENVAHEVNRIDLFGKVASDLNVDIEQGENVQRGAAQE